MPILPRQERAQPQAPASVGRFEVNPPSIAEATASGFSKAASAVGDIAQAFNQQELEIQRQKKATVDIKSTELANRFERASKERLAAIKDLPAEADTTQDYVDYDKAMDKLQTEILGEYEGWDPQLKALTEAKLRNTYASQESFRNIQQNEQIFKYRRKVIDDKVDLASKNMFEAGRYLDAAKPETFDLVKKYFYDIRDSRIAEGMYTRTLPVDGDGNPTKDWLESAVGTEVRKNVGNTVVDMVKTLNATGKVNEAKMLIDEYADYMNVNDRAKLLSDNDEANVKNTALNHLRDLENVLRRPPTLKEINNYMPDGKTQPSEAVQMKMREFADTNSRLADQERKRRSDAMLNKAAARIRERMAGPQAYVNAAQYINSPEYKLETDGMDANDAAALVRLTESREVSDPVAMSKLYGYFQRNELSKLQYPEYLNLTSKLTVRDRNKVDGWFQNQMAPTSDSGQMAITGNTLNRLDDRLTTFQDKYGRPAFSKDKKGKYKPEVLAEINAAKDRARLRLNDPKVAYNVTESNRIIEEELSTASKNLMDARSPIKVLVDEFGNATKTTVEKSINSATNGLFKSGAPLQTVPPVVKTVERNAALPEDMKDFQPADWGRLFRKENGRGPKDEAEFTTWKNQKLGK